MLLIDVDQLLMAAGEQADFSFGFAIYLCWKKEKHKWNLVFKFGLNLKYEKEAPPKKE